MSPLITGSIAYDYLMQVPGNFSDFYHAQGDEAFTAAYVAPTLSRAVGGCAGNIAYGLHKLGDSPVVMATAGNDFPPYGEYLQGLGIGTEHIMVLQELYTAQAYIITDARNSQLIIFHPGATAQAQQQSVSAALPSPLAIVAPNGKSGMIKHCRELAEKNTPFIFDPGQAIGLFDKDELMECLALAPYAIFNHSELTILQNTTGLTTEQAAAMIKALFITYGEKGSRVLANGASTQVDCVHLGNTQDPTGCGDAYRAGLMYGLMRHWDWLPLLQFASVIAAIKATHNSGQGYDLSLQAAAAAYEDTFNTALPL